MSDPKLEADKLVPIVHWNEYDVTSEDDSETGGEVYLSLYSPDANSSEDDPLAILVLSATETQDLINALSAELPFLNLNEEAPEREHTDHMQDSL